LAPAGDFRAWQGLGNPERNDVDGRRIGVPVAITAPDGRVHLFVRNAEKGLSTRVRDTAGRWSGWRDTGGGEIQDGLSAVADDAGCVHVFAAGRFAVHHWTQDTPGDAVTARAQISGVPVPGDGPAALPGADGTIELYYRAAAKSGLTTLRTGETADETGIDGFGRLITDRTGFDGYGPVTAGGSSQRAVLLGRTEKGLIQVRTAGKLFVRQRGPVALDGPALHIGKGGRPTVVALGADAHPWLWRPQQA
ncbi:PIG-L family deacetylase, partial [Streptomyces sp. NPDC088178]